MTDHRAHDPNISWFAEDVLRYCLLEASWQQIVDAQQDEMLQPSDAKQPDHNTSKYSQSAGIQVGAEMMQLVIKLMRKVIIIIMLEMLKRSHFRCI